MRSFFRYPGGKSNIVKLLRETLANQHTKRIKEYREPFVGGGSVMLDFLHSEDDNGTKIPNPRIERVWLNDKDTNMAAVWTSVMLYPEQLKHLINKFTPDVVDFYVLKERLNYFDTHMAFNPNTIVERASHKIIVHQTSHGGNGPMAGVQGGKKQLSLPKEEVKYPVDCRWNAVNICKGIDNSNELLTSFTHKNVVCTNYDFEEVIKSTDKQALIYMDPPYFEKGSSLYKEAFSEYDHIRLAEALKKTKHNWVLSYDNQPEIVKLYEGWADIEIVGVTYTNDKRKDTELIIQKKLD